MIEYHFAILALLALAALKLADFVADNISGFDRFRTLLTYLGAIGAVWLLDYSAFAGWKVDVRNHASGVWLTAATVAGLMVPWRAVFRFLTHDRAAAHETLGESRPMLKRGS